MVFTNSGPMLKSALGQKKSPTPIRGGSQGSPVFIPTQINPSPFSCNREKKAFQAGLLTPGSSYLLRLPPFSGVASAAFVPCHSRGPVSESHGSSLLSP